MNLLLDVAQTLMSAAPRLVSALCALLKCCIHGRAIPPRTPALGTKAPRRVSTLQDTSVRATSRVLRRRSLWQRGRLDPGPGQGAVQFLAPVGYVAGRSIAINHPHGGVPSVSQLVEHAVRNIDGLTGAHGGPFFAQAHLARALHDEVDLFLVLVVPRHLSPVGLDRKSTRLNSSHRCISYAV